MPMDFWTEDRALSMFFDNLRTRYVLCEETKLAFCKFTLYAHHTANPTNIIGESSKVSGERESLWTYSAFSECTAGLFTSDSRVSSPARHPSTLSARARTNSYAKVRTLMPVSVRRELARRGCHAVLKLLHGQCQVRICLLTRNPPAQQSKRTRIGHEIISTSLVTFDDANVCLLSIERAGLPVSCRRHQAEGKMRTSLGAKKAGAAREHF